jgi:hypothetical protein
VVVVAPVIAVTVLAVMSFVPGTLVAFAVLTKMTPARLFARPVHLGRVVGVMVHMLYINTVADRPVRVRLDVVGLPGDRAGGAGKRLNPGHVMHASQPPRRPHIRGPVERCL